MVISTTDGRTLLTTSTKACCSAVAADAGVTLPGATVVEAACDLLGCEGLYSRRGQFDSQWYTVKPEANLSH